MPCRDQECRDINRDITAWVGLLSMEDDLSFSENGRLTSFYRRWKKSSKIVISMVFTELWRAFVNWASAIWAFVTVTLSSPKTPVTKLVISTCRDCGIGFLVVSEDKREGSTLK